MKYWKLLLWLLVTTSCTSLEVLHLNRPPQPVPLKVIQISDLHLRDQTELAQQVAAIITKEAPDVLVLTGDAFSELERLPLLQWFLTQLPAVPHKLAILGNHEYWSGEDLSALRRLYEAQGWQLLINQEVKLEVRGRQLRVFGADDLLGGRPSLGGIDPSQIDLFLIHEPQLFDILLAQYPTLQNKLFLAGHTHGGQIRLFGWAPARPRGSGSYVAGEYKSGTNTLFVSKGLGTSLFPLRLGAQPDVVVITL